MVDRAASSRDSRLGSGRVIFSDYSNGAITTGNQKREWVVPFACRIIDVICDSATAGSGGTSDIIDVDINGTTIYTTQGNRPTLVVGDTGLFPEAGEPEIVVMLAGDILAYNIDQIATTGSARFSINIVVGPR